MLQFDGAFRRPGRCAVVVTTLLAGAAFAADDPRVDVVNGGLGLAASTIVELDGPFTAGTRIVTPLEIDGQTVTLDLSPFSVRSADYRVWHSDAAGNLTPVDPGPVNTLRGRLAEDPSSLVVGAILNGGLHASIHRPGADPVWIEPLAGRMPGFAANEYVMYDDRDALSHGTCGLNEKAVRDRQRALGDEAPVQPDPEGEGASGDPVGLGGATYYAQLACDADFFYYLDWGQETAQRINAVINGVNLVYESDVDISHVITEIIIRTEMVYTTNSAGGLLDQFRDRWLQFHGGVPRDVTHLFTGRSLNGGTIGIAWTIGGICTNGAYCLSESDFSSTFACVTDLTTHELGHLWNGSHCSCPTFTMNPSITCANNFNPASTIPSIIQHRNSRSCLSFSQPGTTGACCFADGSCQETSGNACAAAGGIYDADGSPCNPTPCFQPPTGGCCYPDGSCAVASDFACEEAGGTFLGEDAPCDIECPQPNGACCLADGACLEIDEDTCLFVGGAFAGDNVPCAQVQCEGAACPADIDGSGAVDFSDLVALLSAWGPCPGCPADLDGDDQVAFGDLVTLLSAWGPCP